MESDINGDSDILIFNKKNLTKYDSCVIFTTAPQALPPPHSAVARAANMIHVAAGSGGRRRPPGGL